MILHLVTEEKFTDYAFKQFNSVNGLSQFVLIQSNEGYLLDTVRYKDEITIIDQNSVEFSALLDSLNNYSAIILHGMHWGKWESQVISMAPSHVKIAWVLWGGDVYARSDIKEEFLAPITKSIYIFRKVLNFCKGVRYKSDNSWEIPLAQFKRIDYCMTSQDEEFYYVKNFTSSSFKRLWYTYYSIEEMVGSSLYNYRCHGCNIWLGNSATTSNNHFDTLLKLYRYKRQIGERHIIIPLSYPGTWVKNATYKFGKFLFGSRIKPLFEFCIREEYNKLMLNCNTMIMPHYMSQGMGNIYTGLWLGMRVYMSKINISYRYLRRLGIIVYSIEDDLSKYGFEPMIDEDVLTNRKLLLKYYGEEHVMQEVKNVVAELS